MPDFIEEELAPLYRFALLLTGDPVSAERAVVEVCGQFEQELGAYRDAKSCLAFCTSKLRENCLRKAVAAPAHPAGGIASAMHELPEPERSALALFYVDLFPAQEIATLLNHSLEDLGAALQRGRDQLAAHLTVAEA